MSTTTKNETRKRDEAYQQDESWYEKHFQCDETDTLLLPDYSGNQMFMTLGNLMVDERAGLLFIDFDTGDLLTLTGHAQLLWDGPEVAALDGAQRALRFRLQEGWRLPQALPMRWQRLERT